MVPFCGSIGPQCFSHSHLKCWLHHNFYWINSLLLSGCFRTWMTLKGSYTICKITMYIYIYTWNYHIVLQCIYTYIYSLTTHLVTHIQCKISKIQKFYNIIIPELFWTIILQISWFSLSSLSNFLGQFPSFKGDLPKRAPTGQLGRARSAPAAAAASAALLGAAERCSASGWRPGNSKALETCIYIYI